MKPLTAFCLLLCATAGAHVGSPDVFFEGKAGPYSLSVVVRPPEVVPGLAQIEVLARGSTAGEVKSISVQPVTYRSKDLGAPTPDLLRRSGSDPAFFTGELWFMDFGSYNIRVRVEGAQGAGQMNVPVPSVARTVRKMQPGVGALLVALMFFLVLGIVSLVGAAVREGPLAPGVAPDMRRRLWGGVAMAFALVFCLGLLWFGKWWWGREASAYAGNIYKAPEMAATVLAGDGAARLALEMKGPSIARRMENLVPDHGHIMHLFLVRFPEMDAFYHLHPDQVDTIRYRSDLPPLPAGRYKLFADVVHQTGFPETLVAEADLPEVKRGELKGDDSGVPPHSALIKWAGLSELRARRPVSLVFRVEDEKGQPVQDLELYMGMPGHVVVARRDASVFAHVHPMGSVPMAALQAFEKGGASGAGHAMMHGLASQISFPYGFPQPGRYRIWVQVKRRGQVLTGFFDCDVKG